jgi:hypothetical protein
MSFTVSCSSMAPVGTPDHASGGDWSAPSHVYCRGMGPLSAKAGLESRRAVPGRTVRVAGVPGVDAFVPPLLEQAAAATMSASPVTRAKRHTRDLF